MPIAVGVVLLLPDLPGAAFEEGEDGGRVKGLQLLPGEGRVNRVLRLGVEG